MNPSLKSKIDTYINGKDQRPLVVDVSTPEEISELNSVYLLTPKLDVFAVQGSDELPSQSQIYERLDACEYPVCFVLGLGTYLKLFGEVELQQFIHGLLGSAFKTKFVIISYQCAHLYNEKVPKNRDKIVCSNTSYSSPCRLIFVPNRFDQAIESSLSLSKALQSFEKESGARFYVTTSFHKRAFPSSLITIEECSSAFELLCTQDFDAKSLNPRFGTEDQWDRVFSKLQGGKLEDLIKQYVKVKDILMEIKAWEDKDPWQRWLLFIYLKLKNPETENWAVNHAIKAAENADDFIKRIYWSLLPYSHRDEGFWQLYDDRKEVLKCIHDEAMVFQYCSFLQNKGCDAIYYLTDNTDLEKKKIIETIDTYREQFPKAKLLQVLQTVYKDLYNYLLDYKLDDADFTVYFNQYKYLKVVNYLSPDFKDLVDREAAERSFKRKLPFRSEVMDELVLEGAQAYFIDALGVEFLGYLARKCEELDLGFKARVCKANLPTLTSANTEFRDYFARRGVTVIDEKRLDELKHDGKDDFDFDKNKLPIHLIEELRILDDCLANIKRRIRTQAIKRAIIISDHGATRLAILNNEMLRIEVDASGEHGGRVCKFTPEMEAIPNSIIENGYCILADYNAIKGGRVGKVEMHGGATLEEVVVPLIEIFEKGLQIDIEVITKTIKVSFKTSALLKFFSSKKLSVASVVIDGRNYTTKTSDQMNFECELPDIKKAGTYRFEVWDGGNLVSSDNEFKIIKESGTTNNLWS